MYEKRETKNHSTTPSKESSRSKAKTNDTADKISYIYGTEEEPYGGVINYKKFMELTSEGKLGCSWCLNKLDWGAGGITVYETEDTILCEGCSGYKGASIKQKARIYLSEVDYDTMALRLKQAA
jgi:hypothetical protein